MLELAHDMYIKRGHYILPLTHGKQQVFVTLGEELSDCLPADLNINYVRLFLWLPVCMFTDRHKVLCVHFILIFSW